MIKSDAISFHESTVVSFVQVGGSVFLELQGVLDANEKKSMTVFFRNIFRIIVDAVLAKDVGMYFPDGEILTLKIDDIGAEIIIEWNDFKSRHSIIKSYRIDCAEVEVQRKHA